MMGQATQIAPLRVIAGRDIRVPITRTATTGAPTTAPAQLSVLPAQVNLAIYAGDDFQFTLTATDPGGGLTDFTGAAIKAQIRQKPDSADPPLEVFATSVSQNVITLTLTGSQTQGLVGAYVWDCQVTYSTGKVYTLAAGLLSATADVSR
jgi:hypothetical protein